MGSPKIRHGFFGRQGGVCLGDFSSLTGVLREGVSKMDVLENRLRIQNRLGCGNFPLVTADQVHGNEVLIVDADKVWKLGEEPKSDGLVTKGAGILLGVATADCVPLLFFDSETHVIGTAHAGWRGASSGVIENTISAMTSLGSKTADIRVALGPCIHQNSYEVDWSFYNIFLEQDVSNEIFFMSHKDRFLFDLPGYVKKRLTIAEVALIDQLPFNTYAYPEIFFSCRRSHHQGATRFGCQLSVIGLV